MNDCIIRLYSTHFYPNKIKIAPIFPRIESGFEFFFQIYSEQVETNNNEFNPKAMKQNKQRLSIELLWFMSSNKLQIFISISFHVSNVKKLLF